MNSTIDLHMHSSFSDGSETPEELLASLQRSGIRTFSLTDHDTIAGSLALGAIVPPNVRFFYGVEFSCRTEAGKCHILGYCYDPDSEALQQCLTHGADIRKARLRDRLAFLQARYSIMLPAEETEQLAAHPCAGKPHIAALLVKHGFVPDISTAMQTYLKDIPASIDRLPAQEAVSAILAAGGTPVWAHPLGGEGEAHSTPKQFARQLAILLHAGIQGLECFYSRYTQEEADFLCSAAAQHRLLISGGSDYHGANKKIPLGTLSADGIAVSPEQLNILKTFSV